MIFRLSYSKDNTYANWKNTNTVSVLYKRIIGYKITLTVYGVFGSTVSGTNAFLVVVVFKLETSKYIHRNVLLTNTVEAFLRL